MSEEYSYRIENLLPPTEYGKSGSWGFDVYLKRDFAKRAMQKTMWEDMQKRMQDLAMERIIKKMFHRQLVGTPYVFENNSMLATSFLVPGTNNCSILIDRSQIDSLYRDYDKSELHYYPHNVDDSDQRLGLLSLFTEWFLYAKDAIQDK